VRSRTSVPVDPAPALCCRRRAIAVIREHEALDREQRIALVVDIRGWTLGAFDYFLVFE